MKKILLLICFLSSILAIAGPVDPETAKKKALGFVEKKTGRAAKSVNAVSTEWQKRSNRSQPGDDYIHIFNIEGGGYVIVSGDDRTEEILGYSKTGTFNANNIPDNMRAFLQEYVEGIKSLDQLNLQVQSMNLQKHTYGEHVKQTARAAKTSIPKLLSMNWDQYAPYALYCPRSGGKLTLTGCVATAMAQVMGYHKWPNATIADIPSYTSSNQFYINTKPAGTTIDWANIQSSYTCDYTMTMTESSANASQKAVARLMQLCGQSVGMSYGTSESGAVTAMCIDALINYFDYDASAQWIRRKDYSYDEWQDIIYAELASGRPVLYSGVSAGGGHAFVCDGYDKDDFFHINWGWSGSSDDYYRLRLLNPYSQGAGGSSTSDGYGMDQGAGISIKRNAGTPVDYNGLYVSQLTTRDKTVTRYSSTSAFSFNAYFNFSNYGHFNSHYTAFQILNSSNQVVNTIDISEIDLGPREYYVRPWQKNISLGSGLANGTYRMVISSRESMTDNWVICAGSNVNYLEFTISGNTLTFGHGYEERNLIVTYDVTGNGKVNSPQTITLHIKNNGTVYRTDLTFKVNNPDANSYYNAAYAEVEAGETADVVFTYSNSTEGTYILYVFDDNLEQLAAVPVTIGAVEGTPKITGQYLYGTPSIEYDNEKYYVNGNTTTIWFSIQNTGTATFDGEIAVINWYHTTDGWSNRNYLQTVTLVPGATEYVSATLEKDATYDMYSADIRVREGSDFNFLATSPDFEFRDGTSSIELQLTNYTATPEILYDNGAYYVEGEKTSVRLSIKNAGYTDFNGKLRLTKEKHNADLDQWVIIGYSTYHNFSLSAGNTAMITTDIEKQTGNYDHYRILAGYVDDNDNVHYFGQVPDFEFRESAIPSFKLESTYISADPELQYDNTNYVYYVDGNQTTVTFTLKNTGETVFVGKVAPIVYKYNPNSSSWYYENITYTELTLAAGQSTTISKMVTKDDSGDYSIYKVELHYVHESTGTSRWFIDSSSAFEFREVTTPSYTLAGWFVSDPEITKGDYNGDGINEYYTLGDHTNVTFSVLNFGKNTFNGDLVIEFTARNVNDGYYYLIKSDELTTVSIPSSEIVSVSGIIPYYNNKNYDLYQVNLYTLVNGNYNYLTSTQEFEFLAPYLEFTGVYTTSPEVKTEGSNYYIEGDKVNVSIQLQNTGALDYNGRIAIQRMAQNPSDNSWSYYEEDEYRLLTLAKGEKTTISFVVNKSAIKDYSLYYARIKTVDVEGRLGATIADTPDFQFTMKPITGSFSISNAESGVLTGDDAHLVVKLNNPSSSDQKGLFGFYYYYTEDMILGYSWWPTENRNEIIVKPGENTYEFDRRVESTLPAMFVAYFYPEGGTAIQVGSVVINSKIASGIQTITDDSHPVDVYDLKGRKIRTKTTSLDGLPKGVYIINGKKIVKK